MIAIQKCFMRICFLAVSLLIFSTVVMAEEPSGKFYQLDYSPEEPLVTEDIKISAGVWNDGNSTQNYVLIIQITKGGKIAYEEEFSFRLNADKGISFSPTFSVNEMGGFEIIGKLYDKEKIVLLDSKVAEFTAISHIGPFDISAEILASTVTPNENLPAILTLKNAGQKGTDVEVSVEIPCYNEETIHQILILYVPASSTIEKRISTPVCKEEGLHSMVSSIMLLNRTLVTSTIQFFINTFFIDLSLDTPEMIRMQAGTTNIFTVSVTNLGNQKISDLKLLIEYIPLAWQKITPSSIVEVEPGEKVVFIVNITTPQDAEIQTYNLNIVAGANEVLKRKESQLEVTATSTAVTPKMPIVPVMPLPLYWISLIILPVSFLTLYLVKRRKSERRDVERVLKMIRRKFE